MRWVYFVNIYRKACLQLTPKNVDSVLGCEDWLAVNSRSTGPQQQNINDQNCSDDSTEWSTSADWYPAVVDSQQCRPLVYSYSHSMKTYIQQHIVSTGEIATTTFRVCLSGLQQLLDSNGCSSSHQAQKGWTGINFNLLAHMSVSVNTWSALFIEQTNIGAKWQQLCNYIDVTFLQ